MAKETYSAYFRIGNQTAFMAATPLTPFAFARDHGFRAFELFPDKKEDGSGWELGDLTPEELRELGEEAREQGIELTVHAPWRANPLQPETMPLLLEHVAFAQAVGATLLNIHLYPEEGIETFARALLPLLAACREAGIKLAIENTPLTGPGDFNQLFASWRNAGVALDRVGLCFDLGHANLCAATRNDYLKFIDQLDELVPVIHLHLHENYGGEDSHLPLFTGPAGNDPRGVELLLARLAARHFQGAAILEQWPQPPELLVAARDRLQALWLATAPAAKARRRNTALPPPAAPGIGEISPLDPALPALVRIDQGSQSWREKLDGVLLFLKDQDLSWPDRLCYSAIYLRFIATGAIACGEDGRHFRPNHHAKTSEAILAQLASCHAPGEKQLRRKIIPYLPSFAAPFQRAEPLTRIRELAHRNDIPRELKEEIKHRLQNKLHRCASPEELEISAAFLARFRATPGLSASFVEEFALFHQELLEFFNALSLREQLGKLAPELDPECARLITAFLAGEGGDDEGDYHLRLLTELRRELTARGGLLASGARLHAIWLAELGLENYLFALVSGRIAKLEKLPLLPLLAQALPLLANIAVNLQLSELEGEESAIINQELQAWLAQPAFANREWLLRLKATLERGRRLANGYSDWLLRVFAAKVAELGRALGVREETIKNYCEGEIRAHLVFPLSNLVSLLLGRIRTGLGLEPYELLVPGTARGRLLAVESLARFAPGPDGEKIILLLHTASGEEEIPQAVAGIVLCQALPHLSHLGVRARQQGVVLLTCEDREWLEVVEEKLGETIELSAGSREITLSPCHHSPEITAPAVKPRQSSAVERAAGFHLVELGDATLATCGGKALGMKMLAAMNHPAFQLPASVVIPHGVLEDCLSHNGKAEAEYRQLLGQLPTLPPAQLPDHLQKIRRLIAGLELPSNGRQLFAHFPPRQAYMVRSSANSEDLEELAGAGLYQSLANVPGEKLFPAVKEVWSSLWSPRAVLSRAAAGLGAAEVSMAVLIQEMLNPDYSFVIHTVHPVSRQAGEAYMELAVGLGETIVSGAVPGVPYRLVGNKATRETAILAFADFSQALRPAESGGTAGSRINYAECELSAQPARLTALGRRLTAVARAVENAFGRPQDIEGAVVKDTIFLLQSRAQQGLDPA